MTNFQQNIRGGGGGCGGVKDFFWDVRPSKLEVKMFEFLGEDVQVDLRQGGEWLN